MKLSKFLVSVNLAAVLPIVSQAAGHAAENTISDKAAWLKENMASMGEKKATVKLKAQTARLAQLTSSPSDNLTTATQLSNLRPFVANRKLPSQRELDQALVSQKAQLAKEQTAPLSGKISAFYNSANPDYSNKSLLTPKTIASVAANVKPLSRTVHQIFSNVATAQSAQRAVQIQPVAALPLSSNNAPAANDSNETQSSISPQLGYPMMRQAERYLNDQPQTDEQARADQAIIDRYAQAELGGGNPNGLGTISDTASSAGPPPFPLNLLPQASLKQLVRGMAQSSRRPAASMSQQPSFGSWRGRQQPTGRYMVPANLPVAGFHSYARSCGFSRPNNLRQRLAARQNLTSQRQLISRTANQPYPAVALRHTVNHQPSLMAREFLVMRRQVPTAPRVAAYPPYSTQVRLY